MVVASSGSTDAFTAGCPPSSLTFPLSTPLDVCSVWRSIRGLVLPLRAARAVVFAFAPVLIARSVFCSVCSLGLATGKIIVACPRSARRIGAVEFVAATLVRAVSHGWKAPMPAFESAAGEAKAGWVPAHPRTEVAIATSVLFCMVSTPGCSVAVTQPVSCVPRRMRARRARPMHYRVLISGDRTWLSSGQNLVITSGPPAGWSRHSESTQMSRSGGELETG